MKIFYELVVGGTVLLVAVLTCLTMVVAGCAHGPVQFAEARNPNCEVKPLEVRGDWARVLVTCPDEAPIERTYGK
jgi:hypothetical protein